MALGDAATTFLPAAGYRNFSTGAVISRGTGSGYWSSAPYSAADGYHLGFNSTNVLPLNYGSYASGFSVRCVRQ